MDMWLGTAGLAITFIILLAIFLWFFINTRGKTVIKVLLIPVVLWYGLVLYHVPSNLMGLPTSTEIPDGCILLHIQIREPTMDIPGFFYFLVLEEKKNTQQSIIYRLNPKRIFEYSGEDVPKLYELPYDKEIHKRLVKAQDEKKKIPGGIGIIRFRRGFLTDSGKEGNKKLRPGGANFDDSEFEVINPLRFFRKDEKEEVIKPLRLFRRGG